MSLKMSGNTPSGGRGKGFCLQNAGLPSQANKNSAATRATALAAAAGVAEGGEVSSPSQPTAQASKGANGEPIREIFGFVGFLLKKPILLHKRTP